jgi:mono/diheme cytochrome c family protein
LITLKSIKILGAPSFALLRKVGGTLLVAVLTLAATVLLAEADGKWLHRVPDEDHARVNPFRGQPQAAEAGKVIFAENCAKCHGADANGRHNRPSLRSERVRHATDGDLAWMLRNGNPYKGMPPWSSLPEQQRWQVIAYLRTLPPANTSGEKK